MMDQVDHLEQIATLKRTIRAQINASVRDGHLCGEQALGVLMSLSAEIIASVSDDKMRGEFVDMVVSQFPDAVMFEREVPGEVTWQ